jgi:[protein-PII] uridylyltransferase
LWFDDEATGAVVLELRTTDRIGLLYRVAAALESNAVAVRWARVGTLGSSVVDSFGLTGPDGQRPFDGHSPADGHIAPGGHSALPPEVREQVERAVLSAAR